MEDCVSMSLVSHLSQTLVQNLIDTVDAKNAPNYALLLLWASQANAVPVRKPPS